MVGIYESAGPIYGSLLYSQDYRGTNRAMANFYINYEPIDGVGKINLGSNRSNMRRDIYNSREVLLVELPTKQLLLNEDLLYSYQRFTNSVLYWDMTIC